MHGRTAQCNKGAEIKRRRLLVEEERGVTSRVFSAYGHPLYIVTSFRYLGRMILAVDDNCTAVVWNLSW